MDDGANVAHGAGIAAQVTLLRPKAAGLSAGRERLALHVLPVVVWTIRVHQSDRSFGCDHLNCQGQRCKPVADQPLLVLLKFMQPTASVIQVIDVLVGITQRTSPGHQIMVPADCVKPRLL